MLWCANTERLYRFAQTHSVHMHSFLESIIVQKNEKNQLQDIALCGFGEPHKVFLLVVVALDRHKKMELNSWLTS